jgi:hypothetical protein
MVASSSWLLVLPGDRIPPAVKLRPVDRIRVTRHEAEYPGQATYIDQDTVLDDHAGSHQDAVPANALAGGQIDGGAEMGPDPDFGSVIKMHVAGSRP